MEIKTKVEIQTDEVKNHKLQRSLKARHMNMIAIGGSIGTGLFFC